MMTMPGRKVNFMSNIRVFAMNFAGVYPHYVAKAEKKGRTVAKWMR